MSDDAAPKGSNHAAHARWWLTIAAIVAILLGSLLPIGAWPVAVDISPPVKHLIAYGILGTLIVLATVADWRKAILLAALLALAGVAIEIFQIFIPKRSFMWIDIATGSLGALVGVLCGKFLQWLVR